VDYEIDGLKKMGVKLVTNALIGRAKTIDELFKEGYEAVFLGTGAGLPSMLKIPGEELKGVYTANEFLTRVNLMRADRFPLYGTPITCGKNAAVIGAGNTAMDAARTALRLNQHSSTIVYRRSREEAPARDEEIKHAEEEGVKFHFLTAPTRFIGENGWLKAMECIRMELGEPDESGRRRPVPIPGSEFVMETDTVVSALGFGVNPLIPTTTPGLKTNRWGIVIADPATGKTAKHGVFAGGDVITGGATVILAMGQAKIAAKAMQEFLTTGIF
jgi:glutamate synthase (NADPH/NADH) small chain